MNQMYVYGLAIPGSNEIFYVGKTNDIQKRYKQHFFGGTSHKNHWLRKFIVAFRLKGLQPVLIILDTCDEKLIDEKEKYWINFGFENNWPLTNRIYGKTAGRNTDKVLEEYQKFLDEKLRSI